MVETDTLPDSGILIDTAFDELCGALAKASDQKLIADFLECLLTPSEKREVATRWALVKDIDEGVTQREIARKMGLSLCKITRGSKELKKEDSPFKKMLELEKSAHKIHRT